ncbi:MAG: MFS transporter [Flavobacteriales bacterium]|nr:MFS transporter [Flavobacteriales bacterium]
MVLILDFMIMMAANPMIVADLGISNSEFSYLISIYTFGAGLSGFFGVFFLDMLDRKKMLISLMIGFSLAVFFSGNTTDYWTFFIARAISGAFNGAIIALILSIISDLIPEKRRAAAIGFVFAAFGVASVVGIPSSMWLAMNYKWQSPFIAYSIFLSVMLIVTSIVLPKMTSHLEKREKNSNPFYVLKMIFTDGNMLRGLIFTALLVLGQFSIIPYIAGFMSTNIGYTNEDVTLMYFIGGLVTVFLSPVIGIVADKIGKQKTFIGLTVLSIAPFLLLTSMTNMAFWLSLTINSSFFILISGRMIPATTITTSIVVQQYRGSFMSMRTAVQQFSMSLASVFVGLVTYRNEIGELVNFEYTGYFAVILSILAIWVGSTLKKVE